MTTDEVNTIIDNLNTTQGQLTQLAAALTDQNKLSEATKITNQASDLTQTIGQLQAQALTQWTQDADTLIREISGLSDNLQEAIDAISQSLSLAQNVIKALAIADQVLTKAKGLIA